MMRLNYLILGGREVPKGKRRNQCPEKEFSYIIGGS